MRYALSTLFLVCLMGTRSIAQPPPTLLWQNALGGSAIDNPYDLDRLPDGGYVIAASTSSTDGDVVGLHGSSDAWLAKTNEDGVLVWQHCYGGSASDVFLSYQVLSDGGGIAAGASSSSDGDLSFNNGSSDFWVVRLDDLGNILWQEVFGGSHADNAHAVIQANDGGYLVVGTTHSNDGDVSGNHGDHVAQYDGWVVKLDSLGSLEWQRTLGGTNFDYLSEVVQNDAGNYIITGFSRSTDGDVPGNNSIGSAWDGWVVSLNPIGNILWSKNYGGSQADELVAMEPTPDGGYLLTGLTWSNSPDGTGYDGDVSGHHGFVDVWIIKIDSIGNLLWQRCAGGTNEEIGYDILNTTDGGFLLMGASNSNDLEAVGNIGSWDHWVVKFDSLGLLQWQQHFGGTDLDQDAQIVGTSDGGFTFCGNVRSSDVDVTGYNGGLTDVWLVHIGHDFFLDIDINLELAYDPFLACMRDDLRQLADFPLVEPYSGLGYAHSGGGGGESISPNILGVPQQPLDAVVDWIVVELRDKSDPSLVIATRSALLQRDGDVVDLDGVSSVKISIPPDDYYLAVRHRNHLGVMTAAPVSLLQGDPPPLDFAYGGTATYGVNSQKQVGNAMVCWGGDVNSDGEIKYTGFGNDRDPILVQVGGSLPTATVIGYENEDVNLDGVVQYTGLGNDRDPILVNVGGSIPSATRQQQLP